MSSETSAIIREGIRALQEASAIKESVFCSYKETSELVARKNARSEGSVPPRETIQNLLSSEREALAWMDANGVIQYPKECPACGHEGLRPVSKDLSKPGRFTIRCRSRACGRKSGTGRNFSTSLLTTSILSGSRIKKNKFIGLVHEWLLGSKNGYIETALGLGGGTVTDYTNYLREAVTADLLMNDDCMIGGPGITVQIDESKFGKRKYNVSCSTWIPCKSVFWETILTTVGFSAR